MALYDDTDGGLEGKIQPSAAHETVDSSAGDVVPTMKGNRCIYCDVAGTVKLDYIGRDGDTVATEVMTLAASTWYPVANVKKVYRYSTGTTPITTQVNKNDGSGAVTGLKLRK